MMGIPEVLGFANHGGSGGPLLASPIGRYENCPDPQCDLPQGVARGVVPFERLWNCPGGYFNLGELTAWVIFCEGRYGV